MNDLLEKPKSLYDANDYYREDGRASRLSPLLSLPLLFLDWHKAQKALWSVDKRAPRTALDIGAGDGKFLGFLRKRGFEVYGTTASQVSQRAARELYGVEIEYCTDIPKSIASRKYGLITYWHVFEHLADPDAHMKMWPEMLDKDGTIIIEVPNIESIGSKLAFHSWLGSDTQHHINHMTGEQLCESVERVGLNVMKQEVFSLKFTFIFLWSALLGYLFRSSYSFDSLMDVLRTPAKRLRSHPLLTFNALASLIYLSPFVALLTIKGVLTGKGEVLRLTIRHSISKKS